MKLCMKVSKISALYIYVISAKFILYLLKKKKHVKLIQRTCEVAFIYLHLLLLFTIK